MANAARADSLRTAIANAIAENVKAYNVEEVCVHLLGLESAGPEAGDPSYSKRVYVKSWLIRRSGADLKVMARKVIEEYGDDALESLVSQLGMTGVNGELKNLVFAADGPKPEIVLRDAINNVIEITKHAQNCLVYNRPLSEHGLSWRDLVPYQLTFALPDGRPAAAAAGPWRLIQPGIPDENRISRPGLTGARHTEGGCGEKAVKFDGFLSTAPVTGSQRRRPGASAVT
jgi:hypothetical protein